MNVCWFAIGFSFGFVIMGWMSLYNRQREHNEWVILFDRLFAIVQHKLAPKPPHVHQLGEPEDANVDYNL